VSERCANFYHKPAQQKGELVNTDVHTPQVIFNLPQRLLVPLFQRPYVWDEERQWRPLWQDVERVAGKVLASDFNGRHFLGAIVLQQEMTGVGTLMTRTIIDGQQRLTTLQLLFDAIYEEILKLGFDGIAKRLGDLIENAEHQIRDAEDRFKVWPTNRDRDAFVEVMGTPAPRHNELQFHSSKIVKAHEFFSTESRAWLTADLDSIALRASALVDAVATRLDLLRAYDEDALVSSRARGWLTSELVYGLLAQMCGASLHDLASGYVKKCAFPEEDHDCKEDVFLDVFARWSARRMPVHE
jgi:hypothetical protein